MSSDRLLEPAFRKEEEWLAEQCSQVGSPYKGPSDFEDKKETGKRRKRLRYAIDKLKDPVAHESANKQRRDKRAIDKLKDPVAHESANKQRNKQRRDKRADLELEDPTAYSAHLCSDRDRKQTSSSKRPRDDINGELPASPDRGEAMDMDGELPASPDRGEARDMDGESTASPDRGEAAGDGAKADDEPTALSSRYKFMVFVEGTEEQSVDEQIRKAEREAKRFDQCFRVGKSNRFKVYACAVCDRLIIGTAKYCLIAKEDIKSKADRIGCASYESHYGDGSLPDILKKQVGARLGGEHVPSIC